MKEKNLREVMEEIKLEEELEKLLTALLKFLQNEKVRKVPVAGIFMDEEKTTLTAIKIGSPLSQTLALLLGVSEKEMWEDFLNSLDELVKELREQLKNYEQEGDKNVLQ